MLIAALVIIPSGASAAQANESRIYVVSGSVFAAQGKNPAHRVINSEPVLPDTRISTGDKSSALLKFEDGEIVTLQANSVLHVRNYRYDAAKIENSSIVFSMFKGGMRFITGIIGQQRKQAFRLSTPNATIGVRGTEFMVAISDNKLYGQVLKGSVDMSNIGGTAVLGTGQSAVVASSSTLATLIPASAIPSGLFSELLSIPIQPSAIPAPTPPSLPAAGSAAGAASVGIAGGILGAVAGSNSKTKPAAQQPTTPVVPVKKAAEPEKVPEPPKDTIQPEAAARSKSGKGLTAKDSTLGYGGELNVGLSDNFSTRFGINIYRKSYSANASSMDFKFKLNLQTASALADWYPFAGSFRASGGLLYNNNEISMTANPTGGSFIINGVTYSSTSVSSMTGKVTFNKVAPYFGIGWGNPVAQNKGWGLTTDFGVLFQGKPKLDLVITCAAGCPGTLQNDATAENTKLQNDLNHFQLWPVASVGISYQW